MRDPLAKVKIPWGQASSVCLTAALKKLPGEQQETWRKQWAEVADLRTQVGNVK